MSVDNVSNPLHESNLILLQNPSSKMLTWCSKVPIETCMKIIHLAPRIEASTCTRACHRRKMERAELRNDDLWKIDGIEYPSELHFVSKSENRIGWKGRWKLVDIIRTMLQNTRNSIGDTLQKYTPVLSRKFARQNAQIAQIAIRLATPNFDVPSIKTILDLVEVKTEQRNAVTWVGSRQIEITRPNNSNRVGLVVSSYVLLTPSTIKDAEPSYTVVDGQATARFKESSWYHITRSYDFNLNKGTVKELTDIIHRQSVVTSQEGVRQAQWLQIGTY